MDIQVYAAKNKSYGRKSSTQLFPADSILIFRLHAAIDQAKIQRVKIGLLKAGVTHGKDFAH